MAIGVERIDVAEAFWVVAHIDGGLYWVCT
jgi:hypothetical protein